MQFSFACDWQQDSGKPNYRYFKLAFTIALRLGVSVRIKDPVQIEASGDLTGDPAYKSRRNYRGTMVINGASFENMLFVVDEGKSPAELVTFWRTGQPADQPGTKGGAHPFAELYMGYLAGKTIERRIFGTDEVAALSREYNETRGFNIQAWIVNNIPADVIEPPKSAEPLEKPEPTAQKQVETTPELKLINKWKTDVLKSGISYTNYEVDACVRQVQWTPHDERISLEVHWEDGKYVHVKDFGKFDRYASPQQRRAVMEYLKRYDGLPSRPRLILTVKGDSVDWTLASATMLKRLGHLI